MYWTKSECYPVYVEASEFLKKKLGIVQLDFDRREVLIPYFTAIIKYLNKRLILLGTEDRKSLVQEIFDIFKEGGDLICDNKTLDLSIELEIPTDHEEFSKDRLVFSWTNFMSSMCMRLKFQYAYLFTQDYDGDCCRCGAKGQTTKEFESWYSGVFPEDEEYDRCNYTRTNKAWTTNSTTKYCECQRKN